MKITLTNAPKAKPTGALGFCRYYTDHMFLMNYSSEKGWYDARIEPYGPISLAPSTTVFHYGQAIFEGMKCYSGKDGEIRFFRPQDNFKRLNDSADRICMPHIDIDMAMEGMKTLVDIDRSWIPNEKGTSLYMRPTLIGTDPYLGVKASDTYLFFIILSPVGSYYARGLNPVNIYVEDYYSRTAVNGGTGAAKFGGNYGASLKASDEAKHKGFDQVLWLDSNERKYIEEVGSMNICFVIDGKVVTPNLDGSILPGITRHSIVTLARKLGYVVDERKISIDEIVECAKNGKLTEMFGTGTAAVVSPVGMFSYKGVEFKVGDGGIGKVTNILYNKLLGIQNGSEIDTENWIYVMKK
ncbi:MAG: branched-chain amino acid aminotransferase [Clostridia bacterium]